MADFREILLAKAFKTGPASEYNQVAQQLREREEDPYSFYEVALPEDQTWDDLRDRIYPNWARYFKYKRMNPETGKGLTITFFFKDRYSLVEGSMCLEVFRELEGLDPSTFHSRVWQWFSGSDHSGSFFLPSEFSPFHSPISFIERID